MPTSSAEPFHLQVRAARRAAHWSQSELAARAGCRQSQISEFEAGVRGKVARETIVKLAELLGLEAPGETAGPSAAAIGARARCPNFECPSNLPYWVGGQLLFLPLGTAGSGTHCAICGEARIAAHRSLLPAAAASRAEARSSRCPAASPPIRAPGPRPSARRSSPSAPPCPGRSQPSSSRNRRDGSAPSRAHKGAAKEAGRPRPPRFDLACLRAR